jgi:hypothetical protein
MAKFNRRAAKPAGRSPISTGASPTTVSYEGAPAYVRDPRGELFLLAVSNMVGEDTFYEAATERDARFGALVRQVAIAEPVWMAAFLRWLREDANMRSASLVGAAEAVKARLDNKVEPGEVTSRRLIDSVLVRADEPAEMLAYWTSRYGRAIPKPVKRGVADAVRRLYSQRNLLKYDSASRGYRFADVIDLVHPTPHPDRPWQGDLFRYALDRRHGRDKGAPESLQMIRQRDELTAIPVAQRRAVFDGWGRDAPARLEAAGMTWEALAGWLNGPLDSAVWSALIPTMGIMALARNLRNFDEAGVPDSAIGPALAKFTDPAEVARSRMFPFRWLSAFDAAPSLRWGHALDAALQASLTNLPSLTGRTLILIDTSASMSQQAFSRRSTMTPVRAAAVFGIALAAKGEQIDLHGFASGVFRHEVAAGASVIREVQRFAHRVGEVGHGTEIAASLAATYHGQDRVVIVSDMQTMDGQGEITRPVPAHVPVYGFNLGGYRPAAYPLGPNRHEFGGLTDAAFRMLPLLEAGRNASWPWE